MYSNRPLQSSSKEAIPCIIIASPWARNYWFWNQARSALAGSRKFDKSKPVAQTPCYLWTNITHNRFFIIIILGALNKCNEKRIHLEAFSTRVLHLYMVESNLRGCWNSWRRQWEESWRMTLFLGSLFLGNSGYFFPRKRDAWINARRRKRRWKWRCWRGQESSLGIWTSFRDWKWRMSPWEDNPSMTIQSLRGLHCAVISKTREALAFGVGGQLVLGFVLPIYKISMVSSSHIYHYQWCLLCTIWDGTLSSLDKANIALVSYACGNFLSK